VQQPPEFQLVPLPDTNPILTGERFKQYHYATGLGHLPEISWQYVLKEKAPDMIHVLQFPYNGELPRDRLVENEITANADFFVRNHGGVPEIDPDKFFLDIEGLVNEPKRLTLADLQNEELFPRQSNVVSLQCSGTRRIEQIHEYPGDGDELINAPWGEGAIGTARWTGVSLKKVIKHCGGLMDGAQHVELFGADTYFKKGKAYNYVVSVPWRKVKTHEVLLAWAMNGEPLPKLHGSGRSRSGTLARARASGCTGSAASRSPARRRCRGGSTSTTRRRWASRTQSTAMGSPSRTCPSLRPSCRRSTCSMSFMTGR